MSEGESKRFQRIRRVIKAITDSGTGAESADAAVPAGKAMTRRQALATMGAATVQGPEAITDGAKSVISAGGAALPGMGPVAMKVADMMRAKSTPHGINLPTLYDLFMGKEGQATAESLAENILNAVPMHEDKVSWHTLSWIRNLDFTEFPESFTVADLANPDFVKAVLKDRYKDAPSPEKLKTWAENIGRVLGAKPSDTIKGLQPSLQRKKGELFRKIVSDPELMRTADQMELHEIYQLGAQEPELNGELLQKIERRFDELRLEQEEATKKWQEEQQSKNEKMLRKLEYDREMRKEMIECGVIPLDRMATIDGREAKAFQIEFYRDERNRIEDGKLTSHHFELLRRNLYPTKEDSFIPTKIEIEPLINGAIITTDDPQLIGYFSRLYDEKKMAQIPRTAKEILSDEPEKTP